MAEENSEASKKAYDYVILDCPPNVTNLSENVFRNSDLVLVPVVPTILSVRTFDQMLAFFQEEKIDYNKIIPFFSMVEKRKNMHNRIMNEFLEKNSNTINVGIPYLSLIEKMENTVHLLHTNTHITKLHSVIRNYGKN